MEIPIGLPWYRRDIYSDLRKIFVDGHRLPPAYDQWLEDAEASFAQLQVYGGLVMKVHLDPRHFSFWCEKRHIPMDFRARQQFAMEMAREHAAKVPSVALL
jgi:hypothetical protein